MTIQGTPFYRKVNGEKRFYVTYVCDDCGYIFDEETKISKHDRRVKEDGGI